MNYKPGQSVLITLYENPNECSGSIFGTTQLVGDGVCRSFTICAGTYGATFETNAFNGCCSCIDDDDKLTNSTLTKKFIPALIDKEEKDMKQQSDDSHFVL